MSFHVMVTALRMSNVDARNFTEVTVHRGPHGQKSEEGKEDRESDQEGGKEDVQEEIAAFAAPRLRLRIKRRTQTNLFPQLKSLTGLQPTREEAPQDRTFVQTAAAA